MPGDVKSHNTASKSGDSVACSGQEAGYENRLLSNGELLVTVNVCNLVLALSETCYFDDELPAVSELSRSNLKMAERPKAKLSGKSWQAKDHRLGD